jgi:ubiquinone/menaquinone biosynthesis C-methylase UbiE
MVWIVPSCFQASWINGREIGSGGMFSESPELYDVIYGSFKDYSAESQAVAGLLSQVAPGAHNILDIGCGTGEHARFLQSTHGYQVDGLDIEPGLFTRVEMLDCI